MSRQHFLLCFFSILVILYYFNEEKRYFFLNRLEGLCLIDRSWQAAPVLQVKNRDKSISSN